MQLLIDAHVHFYPCYDADRFLDAALRNFASGATELGLRRGQGCLLLTESSKDHYFRQFRDRGRTPRGGWTFRRTRGDSSMIAEDSGGNRLLVVAGRQLATKEGLEVLALGVDHEFPDGLALREGLRLVAASGAVPVIPWGFGKWWFGRRRLLREALERYDAGPLFLGDNGGRTGLVSRSALFDVAATKGILNLPGTDPLPFPSQGTKAGRFGFHLDGALDWNDPTDSLRRLVFARSSQPRVYGRLESLPAFVRCQISMQIKKRRTAPV